jgi:signal transduction histidine kinase
VQLTPEVERALVGIVREALHNVRKHANAESVQLEVRRIEHGVEVAVVDDGIGFDGMGQAGHFGLEQIRELAEGTGGRVDIGSLPGIGTSIRAWIPLPGSEGDGDGSPGWAKGLESTLAWQDGADSRPAPGEQDEAQGGKVQVDSSK